MPGAALGGVTQRGETGIARPRLFSVNLQASGSLPRCPWLLRAPLCSREQPQPLPGLPLLLGKSPRAADAVGRSLVFNAPAASSLLQQEQHQQLLRARACGCEGERAGARSSALPSSPPASLAPTCGSRPPVGPAPSSQQGKPESCPCHLATAVWSGKAPFCRDCPLSQGEEGSYFFCILEPLPTEGNLLGISPVPLGSVSWADGQDQTLRWGHSAFLYPEAEEAGAASSLGIGAEVSAPHGRSHRICEEPSGGGDSSIAGFLFSSLSASPSPPQARTMVQSHWLPCPPLL